MPIFSMTNGRPSSVAMGQQPLIAQQQQADLIGHYTGPQRAPQAPPLQAPLQPDGEAERALKGEPGGLFAPGMPISPGTRTQALQTPEQAMATATHMSSNRQEQQLQLEVDAARKFAAATAGPQVAQKLDDDRRQQLAQAFSAEYRMNNLMGPEQLAAVDGMLGTLAQVPPHMRRAA